MPSKAAIRGLKCRETKTVDLETGIKAEGGETAH